MQIALAFAFSQYSAVAYWAHVAGFASGLAVAAALVAAKVVPRHRAGEPAPAGGSRLAAALAAVAPARGGAAAYLELAGAPGGMEPMRAESGGGAFGPARPGKREDFFGPTQDDAATRVAAIVAAAEAGDTDKAVALTRRELRILGKRAAEPAGFIRIGDALYHAGVYPIALEAWSAFIARADAADARLPEVKYRAGMVAACYLRDFEKARPFLADAAESHERDDRRAAARKELDAVTTNLDRTSVDIDSNLLSGPCAVIRQTAEVVNVAEIGRIAAKATGKAYADMTHLLRRSVGFVATDLDPIKARMLAVELQEKGIPVLIVPMDKLVVLPPAVKVDWAAVTSTGLELHPAGEAPDATVAKGWNDVFYVSAGVVGFTRERKVEDHFRPHGPRPMAAGFGAAAFYAQNAEPSYTTRDEHYENVVVDVFTLNPFSCHRLVEESISFAGSPQAATHSQHLNFVQLVTDLIAFGGNLPANEGLTLVASDAPERRWRGLTFNGIRDFEKYNYWRLQLEQYG